MPRFAEFFGTDSSELEELLAELETFRAALLARTDVWRHSAEAVGEMVGLLAPLRASDGWEVTVG